MFLCLTNHQPKPQVQMNSLISPLKILLNDLNFSGNVESLLPQSESLIPPKSHLHASKMPPKRPKWLPEDPKDNAPIYLNIEPTDVVSMIPTRFGGTQLIYLAAVTSAQMPEGVGNGGKVVQKNQVSIFVKENPSYIANQLGIVAKGS